MDEVQCTTCRDTAMRRRSRWQERRQRVLVRVRAWMGPVSTAAYNLWRFLRDLRDGV